jgi:hypothetical protein
MILGIGVPRRQVSKYQRNINAKRGPEQIAINIWNTLRSGYQSPGQLVLWQGGKLNRLLRKRLETILVDIHNTHF